jgi:hypothetical protein
MRSAALILFLLAAAVAPAYATCTWAVTSNISEPSTVNNRDSGRSFNAHWAWQYVVYANHLQIFGTMSADAYRCTTSLAASAAGNGTYTVRRVMPCLNPIEDIEADARNQFRARAELDDDSFARAQGSLRIKASRMSLDCHAHGGVECSASGHGDAPSGSVTVPLYPGGPSTTILWSRGGASEQVFQASDSGDGGKSPERITCQTNTSLSLSVGWFKDTGDARVDDSKAELKVYGTCDGYCSVVALVIDISIGY